MPRRGPASMAPRRSAMASSRRASGAVERRGVRAPAGRARRDAPARCPRRRARTGRSGPPRCPRRSALAERLRDERPIDGEGTSLVEASRRGRPRRCRRGGRRSRPRRGRRQRGRPASARAEAAPGGAPMIGGHSAEQVEERLVALERHGRARQGREGALQVGEGDQRMERADAGPGRLRRLQDVGAERAARVHGRLARVEAQRARRRRPGRRRGRPGRRGRPRRAMAAASANGPGARDQRAEALPPAGVAAGHRRRPASPPGRRRRRARSRRPRRRRSRCAAARSVARRADEDGAARAWTSSPCGGAPVGTRTRSIPRPAGATVYSDGRRVTRTRGAAGSPSGARTVARRATPRRDSERLMRPRHRTPPPPVPARDPFGARASLGPGLPDIYRLDALSDRLDLELPLHRQGPARERPAPRRRRHRRRGGRARPRGLAPGRRGAEARDPLHARRVCCSRTSPACRPSSTWRPCVTRWPTLGGDPARINPLVPARPRHRPQRPGRPLRHRRRPSPSTSSASTSATGSATSCCAGPRRRSADFRVVPPGTGIVHQVNLEFLADVVSLRADDDGDGGRWPSRTRSWAPTRTRR